MRRLLNAAERGLAFCLLAALSPVLAVTGAAIAVLSRRSPLVAHRRVGRGGAPFWMWKFRTMWPSPEEFRIISRIEDEDGPARKAEGDSRVTSKFARFCRRHSLDELPQLIHVVSGRMSLVGPRPLTRRELDLYYGADAEEVLRVRPGLSGLWQVVGRDRLSYRQRRKLDLRYVRNRCPRLDLAILRRTIPQMLTGRNAC